ncbi:MAG: ATP/GTP-binding protein [Gammaproteobacteria bacterium]|nr:ATP/GTP-binding protein [Gammaproteobacteria bacterium]MDH5629041.1 ATP/GTP-binding protein [Gammaproteobacteria bacterium]
MSSGGSQDSYVVSTTLLSLNDKAVVRSLCMLLSSKFNAPWVVSTDADDGDLVLTYDESDLNNESLLHNFKKVVYLSPVYTDSSDALKYPIRPNNFVERLNNVSEQIKQLKASQPDDEHSDKSSLTSKKIKSLRYFKRLFKGNEVSQQSESKYHVPQAQMTHANANNALTEIKQRFSNHYVAAIKSVNFVFLGTPGSGKTTAINSVGASAIKTEVTAKDSLHVIKSKTTVALDYNEITIDDMKIKLFGNPGQMRFDYMWSFTCRHADVFVILLDSTSPDMVEDFSFYWNSVRMYYIGQPLVVGLTHVDLVPDTDVTHEKLRAVIGNDAKLALLSLDPRSKDSVVNFLHNTLKLI